MKATELRIGNYVYMGKFSIPRLGITSDGNTQLTANGIFLIEQKLMDAKPIPLIEEWLNKPPTEIKEWKGNGSDYQPETSKTNQRIYQLEEEIYLVFQQWSYRKTEQDEWISDETIFINYYHDAISLYKDEVHVLQNLIFALTGKELKTQ